MLCIELATNWLRILSLRGIDKIRNHLVANIDLLFNFIHRTRGNVNGNVKLYSYSKSIIRLSQKFLSFFKEIIYA